MKSLKPIIITVIVVAILVFIKMQFLTKKTDEKQGQKGKTITLNILGYIAKPATFNNTIIVSGTVMGNEEVVLIPETSGRIIKLNFKEGSHVSKGQLLVKINDADLQAQYKKLQIQMDLIEEKTASLKKLLDINGISKEEYDSMVNQGKTVNADMDYTLAQISKTEIYAPFNGIIGLTTLSEGSYVTPSTTIANIQQVDPIQIDFFVSEKYAPLVHKNDELSFSIEGLPEKFFGKVFAIEPKIDPTTRSLDIRAVCPNKSEKIYPGSFAKVELSLSKSENTIMIPTEAIIPDLKSQKVYLMKSGKAVPSIVETGTRTDTKIEIISGVNAGDTVITTGILQLKPDINVKLKKIINE